MQLAFGAGALWGNRTDVTGSGIGPDLATRCDENLNLCVLARDPPSFK